MTASSTITSGNSLVQGCTSFAFRFALKMYFSFRVALSAVAALVRGSYPGDLSPDPVLRPYLGISPVEEGWRGLVLGVWQRWDTLWHMLIAREGCHMRDTRIFAPPLYPGLMRLAGELLGGSDTAYLVGGLVVYSSGALLLFFTGQFVIWRWVG